MSIPLPRISIKDLLGPQAGPATDRKAIFCVTRGGTTAAIALPQCSPESAPAGKPQAFSSSLWGTESFADGRPFWEPLTQGWDGNESRLAFGK